MSDNIDSDRLRREVRGKYRDVALQPGRTFDFRTGRTLAERLAYPRPIVGGAGCPRVTVRDLSSPGLMAR